MDNQTQGLTSFINVIEAIADNKYVLGDRLVEVGVSGPDLEATLSSIAMAQAELGHARLLYNWSFDLKGHNGKKPDIRDQTGKAFGASLEINNWITLIASFYIVNQALDIVMREVFKAGNSDVISRIHKLIKEQREHIVYSQSWARILLQDKGKVPHIFNEALKNAIPEVEQWLQSIEKDQDLIHGGYLLKDSNLLTKFRNQIDRLKFRGAIADVG